MPSIAFESLDCLWLMDDLPDGLQTQVGTTWQSRIAGTTSVDLFRASLGRRSRRC